jgi:hypothetical protein
MHTTELGSLLMGLHMRVMSGQQRGLRLACAGYRLLQGMGWQPSKDAGADNLVLPALKWDRGGLGSDPNMKRLGTQPTRFRSQGNVPPC